MKKIGLFVGLSLALLMASGTAEAASAQTFWAYGNGDTMVSIWIAIRDLMSGKGWWTLVLCLALLGFVLSAGGAGMRQVKPEKTLFYFFMLMLFVSIAGRYRMNVTVEDPVNPSYVPKTVSNVPGIIVLPTTFISNIGRTLAEGIENAYITPSSAGGKTGFRDTGAVTKTGRFDLYGQLLKDSLSVKYTNPAIRASMRAYISDCVVPMLYSGTISINNVLNSADIWAAEKNSSHTMMTVYYDPAAANPLDGQVKGCVDAWTAIAADMNTYAPGLLGAISKKNGYQTDLTSTDATAFMTTAVTDAIAVSSNGALSNSAADWVQKTAAINMFSDLGNEILASDTGGLAGAMNLAEAQAAQKSGWLIGADIFQASMGYVYVVLQSFIIAATPILILLCVIPGYGGKAIASIIKLQIWIALWPILLSIVNFLIINFLKQGIGSNYFTASGPSLSSIGAVSHQTEMLVAAASFIGTSVPMISWAIVSGMNYAFTEFVASGVNQSGVSKAAQQTASDSFRFHEQRWNSVSANKVDTTLASSSGVAATQINNGVGAVVENRAWSGHNLSQGGISQTGQYSAGAGGATASGTGQTSGNSLTAQYTQTAQRAAEFSESKGIRDLFQSGISGKASESYVISGGALDTTLDQRANDIRSSSVLTGQQGASTNESVNLGFNIAGFARDVAGGFLSSRAPGMTPSIANKKGLAVADAKFQREMQNPEVRGKVIGELAKSDPEIRNSLFDAMSGIAMANGEKGLSGVPSMGDLDSLESAYRRNPAAWDSAAAKDGRVAALMKGGAGKAGIVGVLLSAAKAAADNTNAAWNISTSGSESTGTGANVSASGVAGTQAARQQSFQERNDQAIAREKTETFGQSWEHAYLSARRNTESEAVSLGRQVSELHLNTDTTTQNAQAGVGLTITRAADDPELLAALEQRTGIVIQTDRTGAASPGFVTRMQDQQRDQFIRGRDNVATETKSADAQARGQFSDLKSPADRQIGSERPIADARRRGAYDQQMADGRPLSADVPSTTRGGIDDIQAATEKGWERDNLQSAVDAIGRAALVEDRRLIAENGISQRGKDNLQGDLDRTKADISGFNNEGTLKERLVRWSTGGLGIAGNALNAVPGALVAGIGTGEEFLLSKRNGEMDATERELVNSVREKGQIKTGEGKTAQIGGIKYLENGTAVPVAAVPFTYTGNDGQPREGVAVAIPVGDGKFVPYYGASRDGGGQQFSAGQLAQMNPNVFASGSVENNRVYANGPDGRAELSGKYIGGKAETVVDSMTPTELGKDDRQNASDVNFYNTRHPDSAASARPADRNEATNIRDAVNDAIRPREGDHPNVVPLRAPVLKQYGPGQISEAETRPGSRSKAPPMLETRSE